MHEETTHTPIVQCSYQLLIDLHRLVERLARARRFALGTDIIALSTSILDDLVAANLQRQASARIEAIERAALALARLRIRLRLLYDLKSLSSGQLAALNDQIENIAKQQSAWRKWAESLS